MRNDIGRYLVFSLLFHLSILAFLLFRFSRPSYIYLPIQLQFYSQSNGQTVTEVKKKKERIVVRKKASEKKHKILKSTREKERVQAVVKPAEKEAERSETKPQNITSQAGTSPQPVMGSNISLDTANFPYAYYTNVIVKKIAQNWSWSNKFGKLKALVYFRIQKNGEISGLVIKQSSGEEIFDQQAMISIERASPFPSLPEGYKEDSLGIFFEFSYTE